MLPKNQLRTVMVDLHVMIGEYYWLRSRRKRLGALKAYSVALLEALQIGLDVYADLVARTIVFLTGPKVIPLPADFARLSTALEQWISRSVTNDQEACRMILAPIRCG